MLSADPLDFSLETMIVNERAWMAITNAYSECNLAYESDRPHALKGAISTLEQLAGLRIVGGICENYFPFSLLGLLSILKISSALHLGLLL